MSALSYHQGVRRAPPPPLRIQAKRSSALVGSIPSPSTETLLYDLPSAPANLTSPRSPDAPVSPLSSSYVGRSVARVPRNQKTSPRPSRTRSATPSKTKSDIEIFAEKCERWFFHQDEEAGQTMTQTLATLPSHHRAPYVKLQASIRSAYHASIRNRRDAEFRAHLSSTHSGGSLSARARADPRGSEARKERYERFQGFVRTWCTAGMPGTKPFFESLWAIMRLQVVPEKLGGAGQHRIGWEIDDAVFKESAGKDFMLEAVDVLKGVLGFEETPKKRTSTSSRSSPDFHSSDLASPLALHARSQSQPLESKPPIPTRRAVSPPTLAKRPRAPSDPFLDTAVLSRSYASSSTQSSSMGNALSASDSQEEPITPNTPPVDSNDVELKPSPDTDAYLRTWLSPDLGDPELLALLAVFPPFIARRTLPRFPSDMQADAEDGADLGENGIRVGTGKVWLSARTRSPGWAGSWWVRFKLWWRRLFC
ncbi:hypothetical protein K488DRAFT_51438 [Vararia minispora EC-137]|uniref:Uncharacterized protein n=1 Tax=Vararia minispora EC-137 TaxID=1314806 RepID=A0ACB8QIT3_9AGAM|nr:hypothetical protein K488DRAFT_51438 [Vararia minispora EC-137]